MGMNVMGYVIHQERLRRGWSLESLGHGICSPSYLSKIETGRTNPSEEMIHLLLEKMGIEYQKEQECAALDEAIDNLFETLIGYEEDQFDACKDELNTLQKYLYSSHYAQILLLNRLFSKEKTPLPADIEPFLQGELLAWQKVLQHKYAEARKIKPYIVFNLLEGVELFNAGHYLQAIEPLTVAYQSASQRGLIYIMLKSSIYLGNVYACECDIERMTDQNRITARIARAMKQTAFEDYINYNLAFAQIEMQNYEEAWKYFGKTHEESPMFLHKKAICLEKMGQKEQAREVLEKAFDVADEFEEGDPNLCRQMLELVQIRLDNPDYLKDPVYGQKLLNYYAIFKKKLPAGFSRFHIPWIIEWYKAHRMYRDLCHLYSEISHFSKSFAV